MNALRNPESYPARTTHSMRPGSDLIQPQELSEVDNSKPSDAEEPPTGSPKPFC